MDTTGQKAANVANVVEGNQTTSGSASAPDESNNDRQLSTRSRKPLTESEKRAIQANIERSERAVLSMMAHTSSSPNPDVFDYVDRDFGCTHEEGYNLIDDFFGPSNAEPSEETAVSNTEDGGTGATSHGSEHYTESGPGLNVQGSSSAYVMLEEFDAAVKDLEARGLGQDDSHNILSRMTFDFPGPESTSTADLAANTVAPTATAVVDNSSAPAEPGFGETKGSSSVQEAPEFTVEELVNFGRDYVFRPSESDDSSSPKDHDMSEGPKFLDDDESDELTSSRNLEPTGHGVDRAPERTHNQAATPKKPSEKRQQSSAANTSAKKQKGSKDTDMSAEISDEDTDELDEPSKKTYRTTAKARVDRKRYELRARATGKQDAGKPQQGSLGANFGGYEASPRRRSSRLSQDAQKKGK